jgi:hypothetical protein
MDDRLGFVGEDDDSWVMDDFGNLVRVPFTIPSWFWQDVDSKTEKP